VSVSGKEKYREGQGRENIGHFKALIFVFSARMWRTETIRVPVLCLEAEKKRKPRLHKLALFFRMI
jgi:hypothetical protein